MAAVKSSRIIYITELNIFGSEPIGRSKNLKQKIYIDLFCVHLLPGRDKVIFYHPVERPPFGIRAMYVMILIISHKI